jgi:ABC-2 type transport system ATP-binding protein
VLLNSHLLSEVEATCTRVAILNQGQVLAQGTIAELSGGDRRYEIEVEDAGTALADSLLQQVESMGGRVASHEGRWRLAVPGHDAAEVQPLLDALRSASRTVVSLRPVQSSLEELFVKAVSADGGRSRPGGVLRKGVLG